jgi:hypothetical protein
VIHSSTVQKVTCTPIIGTPMMLPMRDSRTGEACSALTTVVGLSSGSCAPTIASSASAIQNFSKAHVVRNAVIRGSLCVAVTSTERSWLMVARSVLCR